ncbi:MAG: ABC transporter ATP-binding protein, partial [Myxococcales bacterium]|nr:ABC transporter ATP-binding protein [Myxococcales bacterium]
MELQIRQLTKTYPNGVRALQGVDLTIPPGMFGLLGPNGAGKSSLMRTIATLQEPDTGTIRFGELDVLKQKTELRSVLGYLPQEFGLYPNLSAEAILEHFAVLKGITVRRERHAQVDALLEQTNLAAVRKKAVGGFSGGMKQRLGIAIALLGRPRLVIVDEPTAGLDPTERHRFLNLLGEIGEDVVVILSTHIVEDVAELCPSFAIIAGGRVLYTGAPEAVLATLRGKIWRRKVPKAELAAFEARYRVISSKMVAGQPLIHVYSEDPIDDGFAPA